MSIRIRSFLDIGKLTVAIDAIKKLSKVKEVELFIPYFPGARQDRVANYGEPLTVKVYANLINSLKLDNVYIYHPHSDVTPALINNCNVISNTDLVDYAIKSIKTSDYYIVSPDAGAYKSANKINSYIKNKNEVVLCGKSRDTETGKLSSFKVHADDLKGKDCIIIDDICDGGGTFMGIAKELKNKNAGKLYLVVSHGIFSKGFKELRGYFDAIYTTDSWSDDYAKEFPEIEKGSEIVNMFNLKILI